MLSGACGLDGMCGFFPPSVAFCTAKRVQSIFIHCFILGTFIGAYRIYADLRL